MEEKDDSELQAEREKLNRLADEALKKGLPLSGEGLKSQNDKVNRMIIQIIKKAG